MMQGPVESVYIHLRGANIPRCLQGPYADFLAVNLHHRQQEVSSQRKVMCSESVFVFRDLTVRIIRFVQTQPGFAKCS